jgi:hypothetical protein
MLDQKLRPWNRPDYKALVRLKGCKIALQKLLLYLCRHGTHVIEGNWNPKYQRASERKDKLPKLYA